LTSAGGGLSLLSEVGVSFQSDGTLKFDSTKLSKVLSDPTKDVSQHYLLPLEKPVIA
jgi:flagellar hook-associated protein 2